MRRPLPRLSLLVAAGALVHLAALHVLDRIGIMDRLLAPSGASGALFALAAVAFLALRVALMLLGPGLLLADLALFAADSVRARRTSTPGGNSAPR